MLNTYTFPSYAYRPSADQRAAQIIRHPVVVVGAGPVGMGLAVDLAQQGQPVVVLDDNNTVSVGSRAVCYGKRFLDISDRLGVGQRAVDKGVTWNVGRVFFEQDEVYHFDMLPEQHHRRPAFINLQQYYMEEYYVDRISQLEGVDLRWKNKLVALQQLDDGVRLTIDTPDGSYQIEADYLVACDGAGSATRKLCGLESKGQIFEDHFLIADVVMDPKNFPPERWFWFNPPFHEGQSTLLHRQADNVWRIDFDLSWGADVEEEKKPENIIPRVRKFLGDEVEFELEWASVYTFTCRRMEQFIHNRIIFAGDAAHQVSPFGARGANSGLEDADNLAWKLVHQLRGSAGPGLLASYAAEREFAADENILNSTRSTDFITPKNAASRALRDAVLELARDYTFARPLINSGRLSVPALLTQSPLNTPDSDHFDSKVVPGAPCTDGAVRRDGEQDYLLSQLGNRFVVLLFADQPSEITAELLQHAAALNEAEVPVETLVVASNQHDWQSFTALPVVIDHLAVVAQRLDGRAGSSYLIRPDQLVAGRSRHFDADQLQAMQRRALGFNL